MEVLVSEVIKHTIEDAPENGPVLGAAIIAQYQRMSQYGITGFRTVAAFSNALELSEDAKQLKAGVKDMYRTDKWTTEPAEGVVNVETAVD